MGGFHPCELSRDFFESGDAVGVETGFGAVEGAGGAAEEVSGGGDQRCSGGEFEGFAAIEHQQVHPGPCGKGLRRWFCQQRYLDRIQGHAGGNGAELAG
ncbi:hypothetical protein AB0E67_35785 [Streptomyces sp. NPDC032161]|uniref:hypothetical protein n=1 Tax=unclassified Streptomyces TaxID=2593676 RepID=UPI0033C02A5C